MTLPAIRYSWRVRCFPTLPRPAALCALTLQAYERGATSTQPLMAFVSLFRGGEKVFETSPISVTDGLDGRSKAVPVRFSVPLDSVAVGRYDCQVTVLDPNGGKAAFWRAAVVVVP